MSRALRYAPPVAESELIVRPRLLVHLQHRFDRPVTAIVAAPGFGKTTLLAQAVRENALSPAGEDHWLTCQRDDAALSFLATGVFAALDMSMAVPEDPQDAADLVAEAIWGSAPRQVAVIFDDAHLIETETPGRTFLAGLVQALPRNGHVVLASRPPLPLPVSRLLANGDAVVLDERDMQFETAEVAAFAQSRGVSHEALKDIGGWPALAELAATVGTHAVDGYIWEELLTQLSPERQRVLGLLVAVGGGDDEIASAVLGRDIDLARLLPGLPLVVRAGGGWWSLHGLWAPPLQRHLDPEEIADARRTAGRILAGRRQYHEAMNLFLEAHAWPEARALITEVCGACTPLAAPDVLDAWLRRLPQQVQGTPEGMLLSAMVVEPVNPDAAANVLEHALTQEVASGPVRYACLNALMLLAFWRADLRQMNTLSQRLSQAGVDGHPEAPAWVALVAALLARTEDDLRAALAAPSLISGAPLNPVQDWLHAHLVLSKLGNPEAAEPLARRSLAHEVSTMRAVSRALLLETLRMRGRLDEVDRLLPDLLADLNPSKVLTSPELLPCAVVAASVLGRHAKAAELLHTLGPAVDSSPITWAEVSGAVAHAFHDVCEGNEHRAAERLQTIAHLRVVHTQAVVQITASALPLLYVLVPAARAAWDSAAPPGHFSDVLALAAALVELREKDSLDGVRRLTPAARRILRSTLPPTWATELAIGLVAVGYDDESAGLGGTSHTTRAALRDRLTSSTSPIAATARRLLRELPATPHFQLELSTLGPLELRRDGVLVPAPELRRERVRQLLAYLLTHDRPARSAITRDLWPDLADAAAGRNLRVTLAYLQNVFESDRSEFDPPYFVRSSGPSLQLVTGEVLAVDSVAFERCLADAAEFERHGALSAAVEAYRIATDIWHGDYFADLPGGEWLEWERDRLRGRFVSTVIRMGNLVLARGESARARSLADRALGTDRWSESAYQLLIAAYLSTGDRVRAHQSMRRCLNMLAALGVPAQPRTLALDQQLRTAR